MCILGFKGLRTYRPKMLVHLWDGHHSCCGSLLKTVVILPPLDTATSASLLLANEISAVRKQGR